MRILVNIDVDDLERAVEFYTRALDLHLQRRLFDGCVAEMSGACAKIYLMVKDQGSPVAAGAIAARDYARHWTPVHLDFEVENVTAAVERAVAAGAKLEGAVQSFSWGQQATLSDPFGHGFCLLRFTAGGYDAVA
jgi:predicted enzyme related to lactoylglutathione lyase